MNKKRTLYNLTSIENSDVKVSRAFERGIEANKNGRPYIIDILIDRGTNASTGGSIDNIIERE